MKNKRNQPKEIMDGEVRMVNDLKIIDGYVIYNRLGKHYYDEDDCYRDIDEVSIYETLEEAKEIVEELNEDEICGIEIHKIQVQYRIKEILERNIVWNVVAGEGEDN